MNWLNGLLRRETSLIKGGSGVAAPSDATAKPSAHEIEMNTWFESLAELGLANPHHQGTCGLEYEVLRQMSRVPLISAIINTRINQVAEFASRQENRYAPGFEIALRDSKREPTRAEQKKMEEYSQWFTTCGDPRLSYDNRFELFVRKITRDSLIFDQATFEIVKTRGGKLAGLVAVDASTIRRAALTEQEKEQGRRNWGETGYIQLVDSKIVAKFSPEDMVFGIRRPRTWIRANGYGYPELEELVRVVANLLNAEIYNATNFKHGMHASGVLAIKSKMSPQLFRAFRREFYAMLAGASNAHKTPIIQLDPEAKEELQNISMSNTNREMEYDKWISFLLRQAAMVYQMDPAEVGYQFGNEGQSNTLNSGGVGDKISYSRERGLRPLLRSLESWLNTGVMWQIDDSFEFRFVGFDSNTEERRIDLDAKSVQHWKTINEVRATHDLKPLASPLGDMIMNASYMQTASMMAQSESAPAGEEEGAPAGPETGKEAPVDNEVDALFESSDFDFTGGSVEKGLKIKSITVEVE